jgi:serine O-acetyltransferase
VTHTRESRKEPLTSINRGMSLIKADMGRLPLQPKGRGTRFLRASLNPGFRSLVLERIQEILGDLSLSTLEHLTCSLNLALHGAEFRPGCRIGAGAIIRHPVGIVIGSGVTVGENCTFQHGVTLGTKYIKPEQDHHYPNVGASVSFGAFATVIGDVTVGDGCTVGALTLVNKSLSEGTTFTGRSLSE